MDFLKKNWAKIITIVIALTGAVLVIVPIFIAAHIEFIGVCQSLGIILFFVGIATTACLKMSDKTKEYAKYVTLCASILVLIFMSIGFGGFCKDKDKAQGALGNAYAIYKSVPSDIEEGQKKIAGLTDLANGFAQTAASMGAEALTTPLSTIKANATLEPLVTNFVGTGLGNENVTVAQAATITATAKAIAESQLPANIKATKQDAKAGALTVLFVYVSMMLAFGLIPAVRVTKKIVTKA